MDIIINGEKTISFDLILRFLDLWNIAVILVTCEKSWKQEELNYSNSKIWKKIWEAHVRMSSTTQLVDDSPRSAAVL